MEKSIQAEGYSLAALLTKARKDKVYCSWRLPLKLGNTIVKEKFCVLIKDTGNAHQCTQLAVSLYLSFTPKHLHFC